MRIRLLALFVFLSSFSFGQQLQYTRVVKGNLFLPPGQGAQNSKMRFQLKYCAGQVGRVPVNPGNPPGPTGLVVSFEPFDVNVASDGSWQTQIYGNDQIICGTDMSGPSRWLIQPVFNGQANAGIEFQIQSCGAVPLASCIPFLPDSAPACSLTVTTNCALEGGSIDQPDTTVTVNAQMAIPNAINFGNVLLPPANGTVINFLLNGNQAGAYLPGNGNAATCLSGTGTWVLCGGGGAGGGVTGATTGGGLVLTGTTLGLIRTCTTNQYLSWSGTTWICTTLSGGGGGGGSLPTTAQYDLFASTGSGGAQASGLLGGGGFMRGQVFLATGDVTSAPAPFPLAPNASVEYFPTGANFGGISVGTAHGLAAYFSHSGQTTAGPGFGNGGVMLGGGNSSGTNYQVYLDCESAPALGCDFKVPVTLNGSGLGGGGGAGLPNILAPNLYASNGSGGAVDSGVLGQSGFLRAYVLEATGTGNSSPFNVPNGSIEYFPNGGWGAGGANGVALHVSHSGSLTGFGGIALAGGNQNNQDQLYLDCEAPPVVPALGCDFKVPITVNGAAVGGPGGSGGVNTGTVNILPKYVTTTTVGPSLLSDNGTTLTYTGTGGITVSGATGTGISMTGTGGTLPTLSTGQGGVGIGLGGIPEYNPNGTGWVAIGSGGTGGGATLPACSSTPANACVLASNAAGTAGVDTHVMAAPAVGGSGAEGTGYIKSGASIVGGTGGGSSPFSGSNASQEWYGGGGVVGTPPNQITFPNGAAMFMGHSGASGIAGVSFGGGSNTGAEQIYLDCESSPTPGCFFKVPIYENTTLVASRASGIVNNFASPISVPDITLTGTGSNGFSITGTGASLPSLAAGQGGIGIGPGGVPYYNNGTGWNTIGGGSAAPSPNQSASISGTTASLTVSSSTTAIVWSCWDSNSPANAIYPSNVSISSAYLVTFTFAIAQTGACVVNSSGGGGGSGPGPSSGTRTWNYAFQGVCQGGVSSAPINIPLTNGPSYVACDATHITPEWQIPASSTATTFWVKLKVPPSHTGAYTLTTTFRSAATSGSATMQPQVACVDGAVPDNPTFTNSGSAVTFTPAATTLQNVTSTATFTPTCADGSDLYVKYTFTANTIASPLNFSYIGLAVQGQM